MKLSDFYAFLQTALDQQQIKDKAENYFRLCDGADKLIKQQQIKEFETAQQFYKRLYDKGGIFID